MNVIPANQCQPSIACLQTIVLAPDELLKVYQSDMTAAFCLFNIPQLIGLEPGRQYTIAANTISLGWLSAVGITQSVSRRLMQLGGLPPDHEVRRDARVPS